MKGESKKKNISSPPVSGVICFNGLPILLEFIVSKIPQISKMLTKSGIF
jgi:hypothetical protein